MTPEDTKDSDLPPPPERPDCCFGGCAQCVLDDYAEAVARWQAEVDAIIARRQRASARRESGQAPATGSGRAP